MHLKSMILYGLVNAMAFYLLPSLMRDEGTAVLLLLFVMPITSFVLALVYGMKQGRYLLYPVAIALLFIPAVFLFYNHTAWVYSVGYGLLALIGNLVGAALHQGDRKKQPTSFAIPHGWVLCGIILLCIATIAYMDMVVRPPYFVKTAVKAPIFFCVPLVYGLFCKDFKPFSVLKPQKEGLRTAFLLGISIYVVVLGAYLIANGLWDLSGIRQSLEENLGIDKENFVYIGLYVAICNSFLEEWFFRGFVFHRFKTISRGLAYLVSSASFAIYHIAIMDDMFGWQMYLLALVGLFLGGTIFNYLNERHQSIYPSWFCHSFANFAINTIGYLVFFT